MYSVIINGYFYFLFLKFPDSDYYCSTNNVITLELFNTFSFRKYTRNCHHYIFNDFTLMHVNKTSSIALRGTELITLRY